MTNLAIKLIFWLFKVKVKTKDLLLFDDLEAIKGSDARNIAQKKIEGNYIRAKAHAYHTEHFIEYLYFQVLTKQRSCALTEVKSARIHRRAEMMFILNLINELREASRLVELGKRNK